MWRLKNVTELNEGELSEAARILVEALTHVPSAWSDLSSAMEELNLFLASGDADHERIALAGRGQRPYYRRCSSDVDSLGRGNAHANENENPTAIGHRTC